MPEEGHLVAVFAAEPASNCKRPITWPFKQLRNIRLPNIYVME